MPRAGGLPRSPPSGLTTPQRTNQTSVYDEPTVRKSTPLDDRTPSNSSKRRRSNSELSLCDQNDNIVKTLSDLRIMVQSLVSDNICLKKELVDVKKMLEYLVRPGPSDSVGARPQSYASVTSSSKVLIINPANESTNPETSRNIIKTTLKPSQYNLCGVTNTKKGGVIVQCPSSAERNKLQSDAASQLGDEFVVTAPTKIRPRVRIFGFSDEFNAVDLVKVLKDQNSDIFHNSSHVSVAHIFKARTNNRFGAKLDVDPVTFKRLIDASKVFICWDSCSVAEDFNIRRCFKCWGFNHVSAKCSATQRCPKCSGTHNQNECDSLLEKCAVCTDAVAKNHMKIETNHTVFSSSCPSYIHRVLQERHKIDYGQ